MGGWKIAPAVSRASHLPAPPPTLPLPTADPPLVGYDAALTTRGGRALDDSTLVILGAAVGVALLYLGSRIRSRSANRPRRPQGGAGGGPA